MGKCQKRPIIRQKRPIVRQKRPTNIGMPEVWVSVKRDLIQGKRDLLILAYLSDQGMTGPSAAWLPNETLGQMKPLVGLFCLTMGLFCLIIGLF